MVAVGIPVLYVHPGEVIKYSEEVYVNTSCHVTVRKLNSNAGKD